jgi:predicted TIM-barrel fold metal-dependent hydrolase
VAIGIDAPFETIKQDIYNSLIYMRNMAIKIPLVLLTSLLAATASGLSMYTSQCDQPSVPLRKWDTHVHLFDPERFPLSDTRTYTPKPATPADLLASSPGQSFLLVQASVENGTEALLAHIDELQSSLTSGNIVRGEIIYGEATNFSDAQLQTFNEAGVRVLRGYARLSNDSQSTADEMSRLLLGSMGDIAREYGWAVSFQLAPAVWTLLEDFSWEEKLAGIPVIAEHLGSVNVPLDDESRSGLESLVRLMEREVLTVKINALHRRGLQGHEDEMKAVIERLVAAGPERLIWGSDWPHVNASAGLAVPGDFLSVNETAELEWLEGFMPAPVFNGMMYANPSKLFH